jgi:type IV secretion system protein VirB10
MFAGRVSSSAADIAHSAALSAPAATIAEGTIIPAVLETAIDTDLSGYVRALISRDVRSFDGSALLIPRASRLIGQYRSGLFAGQSRVYVVWSRVIRPDGVSIRLGSPGIDMAGQSGVTGTVDNHDVARYGPTVMLSLLSGAVSALASHSSSSVTISSSQSAQEAASIALQNGVKIAPTIRVAQGEPIQVFVTKDLLFASPATAR